MGDPQHGSRPQGEPTHYVGVFTDISQIKHAEARLEHLAHYDPLTDCCPTGCWRKLRLAHALEQAQRACKVGVLFIDLDQFKTVNDSLGHLAGDQLLRAIAQRLSERLRQQTWLMGGDEFLIVLGRAATPRKKRRR